MKRYLLLALTCFASLIFTISIAQATVNCFCNALGCTVGDNIIVPKSTCDTVNGVPFGNNVTDEDRQTYLNAYDGDWDKLPPWINDFTDRLLNSGNYVKLDANDPGQRKYLQFVLERNEEQYKRDLLIVERLSGAEFNLKEKLDAHEGINNGLKNIADADKKIKAEQQKLNEARQEHDDNKTRLASLFEARGNDIQKLNKELAEKVQKGGFILDLEKKLKLLDLSKKEDRDKLEKFKHRLPPKEIKDLQTVLLTETKRLEADLAKEKNSVQKAKEKMDLINRDLKAAQLEKKQAQDQLKKDQKTLNMSSLNKKDLEWQAKEHEKIKKEYKIIKKENSKYFGEGVEHKLVSDKLREILKQGTEHQIKYGDAPDADQYLNLKNISFSAGVSGSSFTDDRGNNEVKGYSGNLNLGVDIRLSQRFSISPGIGYGKSDTDNGPGGDSESDNYSGQMGFFWGPFKTPNLWFDGNVSYSLTDFTNQGVGSAGQVLKIIEYDSKSKGVGIGMNRLVPLSLFSQLEYRFGWNGSWSTREAYVDAATQTHPETSSAFHRLTFGSRLVKNTPWGQLFLSGILRYVVSDNSSANRDSSPFDGDIGAGIVYRFNDSCSLSSKINGVVGRNDYQEYNGYLGLRVSF